MQLQNAYITHYSALTSSSPPHILAHYSAHLFKEKKNFQNIFSSNKSSVMRLHYRAFLFVHNSKTEQTKAPLKSGQKNFKFSNETYRK
jgi:hypothetical protein